MIKRVIKYAAVVFAAIIIICAVYFSFSQEAKKTSAPQSVSIPVIMYHQISKNGKNVGRYVISREELEKDLIYLQKNGYETVNVADIVSYVEGEKNLPEKCVMLTFDDGYETGFTVLYPLMQKYHMKAVVSVIGSLTELYTENGDHNDTYSYLDEEEIRLLSESDEIEIQNHSYDMHYSQSGKRKGINKLSGESYEDYKKALTDDIGKMQTYLMSITGRKCQAMTYPFGECCEDTLKICKSLGFKVTFTCEEKVNTLTRYRRESLYNLGRFNRSGVADREAFFKKVLT